MSTDVLTYHNDLQSDGQVQGETLLTPTTVASSTFGKRFTTGLDGYVYAQPLVKTGVTIPNAGVHDVVYVATEHDSVYALDAGSGAILWQVNFTNPAQGVTTIPWHDALSFSLMPEIGITGTPVIDPGTNTLYVVAATKEVVGGVNHYVQRLYSLDLGSGAIKAMHLIADTSDNYVDSLDVNSYTFTYNSGPTVAGTGDSGLNGSTPFSTDGQVHFNALRELQRGALVLSGGTVYVVWASYNDRSPYHGWVIGFDAASLQPDAVVCLTPNGTDGGVWEGGAGLSVDGQGDLFLATGNGTFNPALGDYGDSVVKLVADPTTTPSNPGINGWGLKVADYFASARLIQDEAANFMDNDLGSTGVLLLPDSVGTVDSQGKRQQLLLIGSKEGHLYLLDRNNLGHLTNQVVQEVTVPFTSSDNGVFGTPAYYNGQIYVIGFTTPGFTYSVSNSTLTLTSQSTDRIGGLFTGTPSISVDGASNGIVWSLNNYNTTSGYHDTLSAYSADSYAGNPLYTSDQAPGGRDQPEPANILNNGPLLYLSKFNVPTVANGMVYVGTNDGLVAYGRLDLTPAPAITSRTATTFTAGVSNVFTVTSTGSPTATLVASGDLAGMTFHDNRDGTATLSGTPAAGSAGTHLLTIKASNGQGPGATQNFTLNIGVPTTITSAGTTTFTTATPNSFTVTTSGSPSPYIYVEKALPRGVTFLDNGNGTATLSGTPAPGTGGSYTLTLTANNNIQVDAQVNNGTSLQFSLIVDQPSAITSLASAVFPIGAAGSFQVTATGFPNPTVSESGTLPLGVTFDPTKGTLGGTPAAGTVGIYHLTFTAHNGINNDAVQNFTLTVGQAPSFTSVSSTTFVVGQAGSFAVTAVGPPSPTLSEVGGLPLGVTFDPGTGLLGGTPASGAAGTYNLSFAAANGIGFAATQSFTLTVNQAPAITSASNTAFVVGQASTFTMTTTGTPTPRLSETGTLPAGVSFVDNGNGTATLGGTPAADTVGKDYPLTLVANNGVGTPATLNFTLSIIPPSTITITGLTNATFVVGSPGTFQVASTGTPAPSFSESGTLPAGLSFVDNGDGTATFSGTPAPGTGKIYPVIVSARNSQGATAQEALTLTVDEAPAIGGADSATLTAATAGSYSFGVVTTGFPRPTFALADPRTGQGTLPVGVSLDPASGLLGGTPAAISGGIYPLQIIASNGVGTPATKNFQLIVNQAPAITSGTTATFLAGAASSFSVTTLGYPKPTISSTGDPFPKGVTLDPATGLLGGIPAAGTGGTYHFTFHASNGNGPDVAQDFTLTVNEAPAINGGNPNVTLQVGLNGSSLAVPASGFPKPTFTETGILPAGVTLDPVTGLLVGTPAAGTGGTYALTILASNGVGPGASLPVTLVVDEAPAITSGNSTTFTVGLSQSITIGTSGFPHPTFSLGAGSDALPSGVQFVDNGDGTATLAGIPTAGTAGTYHVSIVAANGIRAAAVQPFTLTVNPPAALLAITSGDRTTFTVGTAGQLLVTTSGFPTPTLSRGGSLPRGLSFVDNGDGTATLSGTPADGTGGIYHLSLFAHNGSVADSIRDLTLTVDQPAAITSGASTTFLAGSAGGFLVTTALGTFPSPSLGMNGPLPGGLLFVDNGDGTATLAGTPANGTGGTYPLSLFARNGVGVVATQNFTLTVARPQYRPTIESLGPLDSPRTTPVSVVVVTLSEPIDPATFTVSSLLLTRDGVPLSLATAGVMVSSEAGSATRFAINGLEGLTAVPGSYTLMVNEAAFRDRFGTPGKGARAVNFVVSAPPPQVTSVQQVNLSRRTSLLVSFSEPLNPRSATNLATYTLIPMQTGRHQPPLPRVIAAATDASARMVTLTLSRKIKPGQLYQLQVNGGLLNGLTSQSGTLLAGAGNGKAGTNYAIVISGVASQAQAVRHGKPGSSARSLGKGHGRGRSHGGAP